jgi:AcrR family transcriptional regulator
MTAKPLETVKPRGELTRQRLLEAAHRQFVQHGYHGTSMRQIAQAAEMAVGGIYNHFSSKEDVFAAVLDQHHPYHVLVPALEQAQGDSMEAFVRHVVRLLEEAVAQKRDGLLPLVFIELLEFRGEHLKDLAERVFPILAGFMQRFAERSGDLRPVALPIVQRAFVSLMLGYFFTGFVLHGSPLMAANEAEELQAVVDVFLHGILKGAPNA